MTAQSDENHLFVEMPEIKEFARFSLREQRYIRRSLDVRFGENESIIFRSARDELERTRIKVQKRIYGNLSEIAELTPKSSDLSSLDPFMAKLTVVTAFDLSQDGLQCFSSYRFLYERLLGAEVRPWLPSAFCSASALPHLNPDKRRTLLQSISEAAATAPGWSNRRPLFFPEWIDEVGTN